MVPCACRWCSPTLRALEDKILAWACLAIVVLMLVSPALAGGGPEQKQVKVNVDIVVPPPEPNNWPAIIGAAAVLGAAGLGIMYRRKS